MTRAAHEERARRVRQLLEDRLAAGKHDHRWDDYSAEQLIREAQEEMFDAALYLERLVEKLSGR